MAASTPRNTILVNQPEVFVAGANNKFDAQGRLTDEPTRKFAAQLMQALVNWTARLRGWLMRGWLRWDPAEPRRQADKKQTCHGPARA